MTKEDSKDLKEKVLDLFNQARILLEDVGKEYETQYNYDTKTDEENPNWSPENEWLLVAKNTSEDLCSRDGGQLFDYYSSACW